MNLDFNSMDPWEFELLVADLLRADRGWQLEVFAAGRDGGVDLRGMCDGDTGSTIVQCKRYAAGDFSGLRRAVQQEVINLHALSPERYVLATTVKLTPARKTKLLHLLASWVIDPRDIVGNEDLQASCRRNPDVLRGFPSLWLTTLPLVQRFLNSEIRSRTDNFLRTLQERQTTWVNTPTYSQAVAALERTNLVILSGQPGVGKTHLAQMLTLASIADGYEPTVISGDIGEVEAVWGDQKQMFIFDDFLGQISLGRLALNRNETQRIRAIVGRIERSEGKRLILTTREYILSEAAETYEGLDELKRSLSKTTVNVRGFPRVVRASIVASHLARSSATDEQINRFLASKDRHAVIDHKKFNPRAIEHAAKALSASEDIGTALLDELDNPWRTWQHIYTNLAPDVRLALGIIFTLAPQAQYTMADTVWVKATGGRADRTFDNCVRVLSDSLIQVDPVQGERDLILRTVDPSVLDFLRNRLRTQGAELDPLIDSLTTFRQLTVLDAQVGMKGERAQRAFDIALDLAERRRALPRSGEEVRQVASFGASVGARDLQARMTPIIEDLILSNGASIAEIVEALQAASDAGLTMSPTIDTALRNVTTAIVESVELDDWSYLEEIVELGDTWNPAFRPNIEVIAGGAHAVTLHELAEDPTVDDLNRLLDLLSFLREELGVDTAATTELAWQAWSEAGGDDLALARQGIAQLEMMAAHDRWNRLARSQSDADVDAALAMTKTRSEAVGR